ncbi:cryptochrome/photolyase family protein [bacterium]|nr:cryptochrome/photolyase family protein [bacterium]
MAPAKSLRLVLGDQLNPRHSWYRTPDDSVVYGLMEIRTETDYVEHHIQKVLGIFGAMRRFAHFLLANGHRVVYLCINDPENKQDFFENLKAWQVCTQAEEWSYQEPDEYRLHVLFKTKSLEWGFPCTAVSSEHFFLDRSELSDWLPPNKTPLMERFYRKMRLKTGYLMSGSQPEGGQWNFDHENRSAVPKGAHVPEPLLFRHDLRRLEQEISEAGIRTVGRVEAESFVWPLDRTEALALLHDFAERLLAQFGRYQDALSEQSWSLWHSRLSFALNLKMLSPAEVVKRCEQAFRERPEAIGIAQIEGFVRQILGWREYVRALYWTRMPTYGTLNFFEAGRPLPSWYWTGQTRMRCLHQAIEQTLEHAYAHHIQRLMVTGNFGLLAGIDPDALDRWYLGVYIDAFEWVELPNTRGMSQYADGGIMASKPYAASANYLKKQGDHCRNCFYDPNDRVGPRACPFNSLYWDFIDRNRPVLERNPRMGMVYRSLDKRAPEERDRFRAKAAALLDDIESL